MNNKFLKPFTRIFFGLMAAALIAFNLPNAVQAAAIPTIEIIAVKTDDTVTIRTHDFPSHQTFTVRMDKVGNLALDGYIVATTDSGSGGSFDVTYKIPSQLYGLKTIAIRLDSNLGFYSYDWFVNKTGGTGATATPAPVTGSKPLIDIIAVDKNSTITVRTYNFPANTTFSVRVGPYYTFFRDYVVVQTFNSGSGGSKDYKLNLPAVVKDIKWVTVRFDCGSGCYAYNAFVNATGGMVSPTPVTPLPTATPSPVQIGCSILSTTPTAAMNKNYDFDGLWEVKNTGTKTWDMSSVDYKFVNGTHLNKYNDRYDMKATVKPGETVKIRVDMLAPATSGWYSTNWAIVEGSTTLCKLPLTIHVK